MFFIFLGSDLFDSRVASACRSLLRTPAGVGELRVASGRSGQGPGPTLEKREFSWFGLQSLYVLFVSPSLGHLRVHVIVGGCCGLFHWSHSSLRHQS